MADPVTYITVKGASKNECERIHADLVRKGLPGHFVVLGDDVTVQTTGRVVMANRLRLDEHEVDVRVEADTADDAIRMYSVVTGEPKTTPVTWPKDAGMTFSHLKADTPVTVGG